MPSAGVNAIESVASDTFHVDIGLSHSCMVTKTVDLSCDRVLRTQTQRERRIPSEEGGICAARLTISMAQATDFPLAIGPRIIRMGASEA